MSKLRNKCPKIGEVYLMYFDGNGSAQRGWRPGLIVQNNMGNKYSPNVIALPLTSSLKNLAQPTHVLVYAKNTGLRLDSIVLCENPETISKEMIKDFITDLPMQYLSEVAKGMMASMPMISFLGKWELVQLWNSISCVSAL